MPVHCVERIERALNDASKAVRGAKVAVLGVSYKAGVGDMRESPALRIIEMLSERGADLRYHDPYVPSLPGHGLTSQSIEQATEDVDAVVLVTAHPDVDHIGIAYGVPIFVDLRGVTRGIDLSNLVKL